MTKVMYNGKYVELQDELEPGFLELDILNGAENQKDNTENNLEDTKILNLFDLDDTQELKFGDLNNEQ